MEKVALVLLLFFYFTKISQIFGSKSSENSSATTPYLALPNVPDKLLHSSFPSEADTLAYVDALKHSNFSQWRSLEEVAKKAGGGSCSGAANTSILTALYLLGLFNLCAASPSSCCVPPTTADQNRKRRSNLRENAFLPPILDSLTKNLTTLSLQDLKDLPQVPNSEGGRFPVNISVIEKVRKLWDQNPRLVSSIPCNTATESVRSSFISLSGVASGIILAYSIAQLNQCYPDNLHQETLEAPKIWLFPLADQNNNVHKQKVRSLPNEIPVQGEDDPDDGCNRISVPMRDNQCAQLLSTHMCPYHHWVLLNKETRKGECIPKLCPEGRVFVERDQLCHDINEPDFCPPGQRLYLTAWGEAVCDCNDGSYPGADGNCYGLFETAYCHKGAVLQFHKPSKTLACLEDQCRGLNEQLKQGDSPFAINKEDNCHQLGTIGPCENNHRYGFNVEELSPACVSLKENSLISHRNSFTYSHISFPTESNSQLPHYEVSYVIVNGSTWELLMRTVGREKRDTSSQNKSIVTFLDTRDFPTNTKEINSFELEQMSKDLKHKIKSNNSQKAQSKIKNFKSPKPIKKKVNRRRRKKNKRHRKKKPKMNHKCLRSKIISDKFSENSKSDQNPSDSRKKPNILMKQTAKNVFILSDQNDLQQANLSSKDEENPNNNFNDELVKDFEGLNQFGIEGNVTETNLQDFHETNLTGSHVKLSAAINFSSLNVSELSDNFTVRKNEISTTFGKHSVKENTFNGNMFMVNENQPYLKTNNLESEIVNKLVSDTSILNTKDLLGELDYGITDVFDSASNTSLIFTEMIVNETRKDDKSKILDEIYTNKRKDMLKNITTYVNHNFVVTDIVTEIVPIEVTVSENKWQDLNNRTHIIGLKKENFEPIIYNYNKDVSKEIYHPEQQSSSTIQQSKTKPDLLHIVQEQNTKNLGSQSRNLHKLKGVFTVPQKETKKRHPTHKKRRRKKRKKKKKFRKRFKKRRRKSSTIVIKNRISSIGGDPNNSSKSETLPDYLRNRGRRQAIGRHRGPKIGPGIINAPILNKCRPGAKRDYNGHCRPKIIPDDKTPAPRIKMSIEPSAPIIKCKGKSRLDSRGVCKKTYSGLG